MASSSTPASASTSISRPSRSAIDSERISILFPPPPTESQLRKAWKKYQQEAGPENYLGLMWYGETYEFEAVTREGAYILRVVSSFQNSQDEEADAYRQWHNRLELAIFWGWVIARKHVINQK